MLSPPGQYLLSGSQCQMSKISIKSRENRTLPARAKAEGGASGVFSSFGRGAISFETRIVSSAMFYRDGHVSE
jgi:hypothetical protein